MAKGLRLSSLLVAAMAFCFNASPTAPKQSSSDAEQKAQQVQRHTRIDRSGKKQQGKASYYSRKFAGKKTASGVPMNPNANVAASKTLPLGTRARVKNLQTGKSTEVEVQDRGPYVKDRIIDLSPKAAKELDMGKQGVAPVEVAPIELPQPNGHIGPGAAQRKNPPKTSPERAADQ